MVEDRENGMTYQAIANKYGVSRQAVFAKIGKVSKKKNIPCQPLTNQINLYFWIQNRIQKAKQLHLSQSYIDGLSDVLKIMLIDEPLLILFKSYDTQNT